MSETLESGSEQRAVAPARILLVDDDRDLVAVLRLVLEARGHTVLAAHDPVEGMRQVEAQRPDLLILDVMMPDSTEGFHMVWKLRVREDPYFQHVPIIMLTAVHQRTPLRFYPDAGDHTYAPGEYLAVADFLDKPVEPELLVRAVERALKAGRPAPRPVA
jgi:CheY-like chemotaxis protein